MFHEQSVSLDDAIKTGVIQELETFECPHDTTLENTGIVKIVFPEFTSVCPKTGYPDFAKIDLYYLPNRLCVELKAWKLYLNSFRMVGAFHEKITKHIYDKVNAVLAPKWCMVVGDFFPRGNVNTTVVFETPTTRPIGIDVLLENYKPHSTTFRH